MNAATEFAGGLIAERLAKMIVDDAIVIFVNDGTDIVTVAVWIGAADERAAHRGGGPFADGPQRGVDGVNVVVAEIITADGDVVDPDQVLKAAFEVGRFRRVGKSLVIP